jgi:hypothetical protein
MPPKRNRDGYATFWRLRACPERSRMGQSPLLMIIETQRLILRPFREEDLDLLAELMANPDFMRFSLGPFSREQTVAFLEKVLSWDRASLPSQFAVIMRSNGTLVGYCGFFHHEVDKREEIEIGYRLHPAYWNQGLATGSSSAKSRFSRPETTACDFFNSPRQHPIASRRRKKRNET